MSDEKASRFTARRLRIDINDANEVRYWTEVLAVSEEQLKSAVAKIGTRASRVQQYLANGPADPGMTVR